MIRNSIAFFLSAMLTGSATFSQNVDTKKMDSLLNNLAKNNKAMGSLLISKKGVAVYNKSIGFAFSKNGLQKELSEKTRYRIGSIAKVFTAVLIFQLIEEKKLSLATPLSTFFKEFPNADTITIGHLLSHRSGLYNYTRDWDSWRFSYKSPEEIRAIIAGKPPEFEPGTKTSYSNSNYMILGYIIEQLTRKQYAQVLKEKIVLPLGLKNTYVGGKIDTAAGEAFSYNYEQGAWKQQPETDMSAAGGAGAIVSTTQDMNRFIETLFNGKLIKKSSLSQMQTIRDGEGMGIQKLPFFDETLYGHSGWIDYFQSYVLYFPAHEVAVSYVSNGFGGVSVIEILSGVLHVLFKKPYTVPGYDRVILTDAEINTYLGVYSNETLKMKITVTRKGTALMARAEGQDAFELQPQGNNTFKFDPAGIQMEFSADRKEMILKQGGGSYTFRREE